MSEEFSGSRFVQSAPGVMLGCISRDARNLLDAAMAEWEKHKVKLPPDCQESVYSFAYWLIRWSGLVQDTGFPLPDVKVDRETLGRVVREAWLAWVRLQPDPKPSWLEPWESLSEDLKEVDRQIGEAIARLVMSGEPRTDARTDWNEWLKQLLNEQGKTPRIVEVVDVNAPPCAQCKFWLPRRSFDTDGQVTDVRFCWANDQCYDFSCFERRQADDRQAD